MKPIWDIWAAYYFQMGGSTSLDYCVAYNFFQSMESGRWIIYQFGWFSLLRSYKESLIYRMDDSWNKVGFLLYHHDVSHVVLSFPSWKHNNHVTPQNVWHVDFLPKDLMAPRRNDLGIWMKKRNHITWLYERWCNCLAPNFLSFGDFLGLFLWMQSFKINTIQYLDTGRVSRVIGSKVPFFEVPFKHLRKPFTFQSSFWEIHF